MKHAVTLLSAVSLFFLIGCSASEEADHRRGSLKDAAEAASDRHTGPRTVDAEFRPPHERTATAEITVQADSTVTVPSQDTIDYHFSGGLVGGLGLLSSNEFYGQRTLGIFLTGDLEEGTTTEVQASITTSPLQRTSSLSHSISDGVLMLDLNARFRFPTTPPHTFIGQYFLLGFGGTWMNWTYKNPITAPVYNSVGAHTGYETITSDQLKGLTLFAGFGLDLTQTLPVHLIVEMTPGVLIWTGPTSEGFDNDLFANFAFLQFQLKVGFGGK